MARRAALSFGSLNPFGGGDLSFGSFNVGGKSGGGGSSTVDPSQAAYLEFQKIETEWQAGRIDDATYQNAFQQYQGALEAGTSEFYNAQSRLESMQYSMARDSLLSSIARGESTWSDLVTFDQASLSGLNPNSQEYRDREGRMFAAQTNEFRVAERAISDDLEAGRINYTQALAWYEGAQGFYANNFELADAIGQTIEQVQVRIVGEQDQAVLDDWKAGKLGLDQLLSYSAKIQAENPNTERARVWAENSQTATVQTQESSLLYRYSLTEEYRDLAALVASVKAPTGSSSVSKATQYYVDANGNWKTRVVTSSRSSGPSPSEQAAYAERKLKADAAKKRMAEIEKMVGGMPGGWVAEDDIIRNLASQQAGMVKGSPAWIEVQGKIDYYNERKAADELMRKSGVVVNLPTSASEKTGGTSVGSFEKPFAPSKGGATIKEAPKASGGGGGGGGGGTAAGRAGLGATAKPTGTSSAEGFLYTITGPYKPGVTGQKTIRLDTYGESVAVAYKNTGLPAGMAPTDFTAFYKGMTEAIKDGETVWVDKTTGTGYVLPPDPTDRLAILDGMDQKNVDLKWMQYQANPNKTTQGAYNTAVTKANTNSLWVMASPMPGIPKGLPQVLVDGYLEADRYAAPIAAAQSYMERTERQLTSIGKAAQDALDRGDAEAAYALLRSANETIGDPRGSAAAASYWASVAETNLEVLQSRGAKLPAEGDLGAGIKEIRSIASTDPEVAWLSQLMDKSGLEEVATFFDPKRKSNPFVVNAATGQPVTDPKTGGFQLKSNYVRVIKNDKIAYEMMPTYIDPLTNKRVAGDPDKVIVQLQVGATFLPVLADYEVTTIGVVVDAAGNRTSITGKVVDVEWNGRKYQVAQDPFNPERWVPTTDRGLTFTLPVGVSVIPGAGALGKTGTQIAFSLRNENGKASYFVLGQEKDGTYSLYTTDKDGNFTGQSQPANTPAARDIIGAAGIKIDMSQMSNDQRNYVNSGLGGVYLGDPSRIAQQASQIRNTLYGPGMMNLAGTVGNLIGQASNAIQRLLPVQSSIPASQRAKAAQTASTARLTGLAATYGKYPVAPAPTPSVAAQAASTARYEGLADYYGATPTAAPMATPVVSRSPVAAPGSGMTAAQQAAAARLTAAAAAYGAISAPKTTVKATSTTATNKAQAASTARLAGLAATYTPKPTPKITAPPTTKNTTYTTPELERLRAVTGGGR